MHFFFASWGCCYKKCIHQPYLVSQPQTGFLRFKIKKKIFGKSIIFWDFLDVYTPSHKKFGKFSLKIGGEIIFQSWPLFNLFSQLTHCALSDRVEIFLRYRWSPPQKNIKQFLCHRSYWLSKRNLKFTNTFSLFLSCVKYLMLFDVFNSSPQFYSHPACRTAIDLL